MNFLPRFSRLMAEALHCGGAPEGLALPLSEAHGRLIALADEERALPLPPPPEEPASPDGTPLPLPDTAGDRDGGMDSAARRVRLACDQARFAVYAWVDEQLLQSPRPDAADWLSHSLQYRYCGTASAGQEFFTRLTALVRQASPPLESLPPPASAGEAQEDDAPRALEAFALGGGDSVSTAAVSVYALCLLYGFRGMLRDSPETLHRYRKAARTLLLRAEPPPEPGLSRECPAASLAAATLEKAAYILLPPLTVALFGALCAAALSGIPLPQF